MAWKIGQAKQRFSEVVRRAGKEPQIIENRNRPVAAIIAAEDVEPYLAWKKERRRRSMRELIEEAQRICGRDGYTLEIPPRTDRPQADFRWPEDGPRRHKRRQ